MLVRWETSVNVSSCRSRRSMIRWSTSSAFTQSSARRGGDVERSCVEGSHCEPAGRANSACMTADGSGSACQRLDAVSSAVKLALRSDQLLCEGARGHAQAGRDEL